jgi:hypothetical protein
LVKLFFFNLLISYYESNFLFISAAIILQLMNPDFSTVFNTISFFSMGFYIRHLFYFYTSLYKKVNLRRIAGNYKNTVDKFSILIEDIKYNLHEFDRFNYKRRSIGISKNKFKNYSRVNYHFLGYIKKIVLLLLAILSHVAPKTAISLGICLFLLQFLMSIYIRPFIFIWVGILKSLTDFLDLLMMILMLTSHILKEKW